MKVGDKVRIRESSDYYSQQTKEADNTYGEVTELTNSGRWADVRFVNGFEDYFPTEDLIVSKKTEIISEREKYLKNAILYNGSLGLERILLNTTKNKLMILGKIMSKLERSRTPFILEESDYYFPKEGYRTRKYVYIVLRNNGIDVINSRNTVFINIDKLTKKSVSKVKPKYTKKIILKEGNDKGYVNFLKKNDFPEIILVGEKSDCFYFVTHPIVTKCRRLIGRWAIVIEKKRQVFAGFHPIDGDKKEKPHVHMNDSYSTSGLCWGEYRGKIHGKSLNSSLFWLLDFISNIDGHGLKEKNEAFRHLKVKGELSDKEIIKEVEKFIGRKKRSELGKKISRRFRLFRR